MNLCTSVFVYVCSIGLYKRIVNADTQNIRIANAEGQKTQHIDKPSPVNVILFHETIEHILLAGE